jgi:hypothetical protein
MKQFIGVVLKQQRNFFGQGHGLAQVADRILDIGFLLFGAHKYFLSGDRVQHYNSQQTRGCIIHTRLDKYFQNIL